VTDNWITYVSEPERLILAWQAPDEFNDRTRFAVGELACTSGTVMLRYFGDDAEFARLNPGKSYQLLISFGYRGYPGFSLDKREHRATVLEAFMRRLPPRSRPDFAAYARHLRLRVDTEFSAFALLSLSEAYLPSDGFSVVDPLTPDSRRHELVLEVAGYRYYALKGDVPLPKAGDAVEILPEPGNAHDANAVQILFKGSKIGNVNRLQAETFRVWTTEGRVSAVVDRLNGRPQRPRLFLFVRIAALEERANGLLEAVT
jgi:hypothetical protein